jgi:hypothetical protein
MVVTVRRCQSSCRGSRTRGERVMGNQGVTSWVVESRERLVGGISMGAVESIPRSSDRSIANRQESIGVLHAPCGSFKPSQSTSRSYPPPSPPSAPPLFIITDFLIVITGVIHFSSSLHQPSLHPSFPQASPPLLSSEPAHVNSVTYPLSCAVHLSSPGETKLVVGRVSREHKDRSQARIGPSSEREDTNRGGDGVAKVIGDGR